MGKRYKVFSSNTQGRHGAGLALDARLNHKAIYGQAVGFQGNSYAIVTKDLSLPKHMQLRSIPLCLIRVQIDFLIMQARLLNSDDFFDVGPIGCGLAGYYPHEIAPMFKDAPPNVILPQLFLDELNKVK